MTTLPANQAHRRDFSGRQKLSSVNIMMAGYNLATDDLATDDSTVPHSFICSITQGVMLDPVMTEDGHSYERSAITNWFRHHSTSPVTGSRLSNFGLTTNIALRNSIDEWRQQRFRTIHVNDLEIDPSPFAAGTFKRISRAYLRRLPGTVALLPQPLRKVVYRSENELAQFIVLYRQIRRIL